MHEHSLLPIKPGAGPSWILRAGYLIGCVTFLVLTALVFRGRPIPCDLRFPLVGMLGLGTALASGFIGGAAIADGKFSFDPDGKHAIRFGVGGGSAVLLLVIGLGGYLYRCPPEATSYEIQITSPRSGAVVAHVDPIEWSSPWVDWHHYIVVQWAGDAAQWVQAAPSPMSAYRWSGAAVFGDAHTPPGAVFFVSILATRKTLSPGIMATQPSDARVSPTVSVRLATTMEVFMSRLKAVLPLGVLLVLVLLFLPRLLRASPSAAASPHPGSSNTIAITSPKDEERVPERPLVVGSVSDPRAQVWVIVHPVETAGHWVQPVVVNDGNGHWKVQVYIGRPGELDIGKQFEVRAIANPKAPLREGEILGCWPEAEWQSQVIRVFRK
jgi:hypothetical protein